MKRKIVLALIIFDVVPYKGLRQLQFSKKAFLKLSTDLKALDQVLAWFDNLDLMAMPKQDWTQSKLALAEGFTNAVNHAHKDLSFDIPIEIEITLKSQCLEIRIWDRGPQFDLEAYIENLDEMVNNQEFGNGRGIPILCKISDHLSYTRTEDNRNCLLIVKAYTPITVSS